jgi:hypothetical protein
VKKAIDLNTIVDSLESQLSEGRAFLDRDTGELYELGPEELSAADSDDAVADYPEWQQPLVELARLVFSDSSDRFIELPDRWEVHEYRALESFAATHPDAAVAAQLLAAIRGAGAFRRFKAAIHHLGIADSWYTYRRDYLLGVARDWCEENSLPYQEKNS